MKKRLPPEFRIAFDHGVTGSDTFREVLPFQRSWLIIGIITAVLIVFLIPAVSAYGMASSSWSKLDSLMDLVSAVFTSAWLLGWSLAPLVLSLILAVMLFGREVIQANSDRIEIGIGLPGLVLFIPYDPKRISRIRLVTPEEKSGTSWRGRHLAFNHGTDQIDFGSAIDETRLEEITFDLQSATGIEFPDEIITDVVTEAPEAQSEPNPVTAHQHEVKHSDEGMGSAVAEPVSIYSTSTLLLIITNLAPIVGWLFLDWRIADVMVLYWLESAVIGVFNVCKMAVISKWLVLFQGVFFLAHYTGFMAVHFLFIYSLFVQGIDGSGAGDSLAEVGEMLFYIWPAVMGLFISHGYSFYRNYLGRKEYVGRTIKKQMMEPYSRIIFMHLVLIFGGGLAMALGDAVPVILLVILVKIIVDVKAHLKQRVNLPEQVNTQRV